MYEALIFLMDEPMSAICIHSHLHSLGVATSVFKVYERFFKGPVCLGHTPYFRVLSKELARGPPTELTHSFYIAAVNHLSLGDSGDGSPLKVPR